MRRIPLWLATVSTIGTFSAGAWAQSVTPYDQQNRQGNPPGAPDRMMNDQTPEGTNKGASQGAKQGIQSMISSADRDFTREVAQANRGEVRLARLALQKSRDPMVRSFAQHMVNDHSKAGQDLTRLAGRLAIELPMGSSSDEQATYDRLSKLSGDAFDRAYLQQEADDHQKVISRFEKEVSEGQSPGLQSWAKKTLPTLKSHRDMVQKDLKSRNM